MPHVLGKGATVHALNPVKTKADPQLAEDTQCSLVGNTFHAGVVALAMASLFVSNNSFEVAPTPQEVVQRMGLFQIGTCHSPAQLDRTV